MRHSRIGSRVATKFGCISNAIARALAKLAVCLPDKSVKAAQLAESVIEFCLRQSEPSSTSNAAGWKARFQGQSFALRSFSKAPIAIAILSQ